MDDERVRVNLRNWDERVADRLDAYGAEAFADDPTSAPTPSAPTARGPA